MQNVRYDFSSCHVIVPSPLADEIADWGKANISDDDIFVTQTDPTFGREDEIHITVLYGLHTNDVNEVKALIENTGPVKVRLGKTNVFSNPFKFDVVMIEAFSEELTALNEKLRQGLAFTAKHVEYHPHVTISYVKKGKGWKHGKVDLWEGEEFICDYVIFSAKDGIKHIIRLT